MLFLKMRAESLIAFGPYFLYAIITVSKPEDQFSHYKGT